MDIYDNSFHGRIFVRFEMGFCSIFLLGFDYAAYCIRGNMQICACKRYACVAGGKIIDSPDQKKEIILKLNSAYKKAEL